MNITLVRYSSSSESTLGCLYINDLFICYTLEDELRYMKIKGETRIPGGRYTIKLKIEGGFHNKYTAKFGEHWHKGMLELEDVPGFDHILMHIGNDDDDTAGCILLGDTVNNNQFKNGFISNSTDAYKRIYPLVRDAILDDDEVTLTIKELCLN
tara:strand:+ start:5303 stop:5764 length:462 start_codon:yes stop_codon:yes gene_type:complete